MREKLLLATFIIGFFAISVIRQNKDKNYDFSQKINNSNNSRSNSPKVFAMGKSINPKSTKSCYPLKLKGEVKMNCFEKSHIAHVKQFKNATFIPDCDDFKPSFGNKGPLNKKFLKLYI